MAIALVAHVGARSTDSNGITSSAIDTTGATLIVINLATALAASGTISDSKGNTWTALTQVVDDFADRWAQLYYCESPTVGSGHTFSVSGSATFPSLGVAAFSGTAASSSFDVQNHATNGFSSSVTTGSVTPSVANELVIAAMSYDDNASTPTIGSSFTITDTTVPTGFGTTGQGLAYLVETTATAQNPTWSWTNGSRTIGIAATFKASGGAAAAPPQGWENLARDIPRPPTVSLSAAPAFVSTFRTAAVAGIAWQGPRDHVKLPPKVSLSEAPGYGRTPFTAASTIAGIAWQGPRDHVKLPPKTSNSEQPALGRFVPAVGISGIGWFNPADRDKPSVKVGQDPAPPAFGQFVPAVGISGIGWFLPLEVPQAKAKVTSDPPATAFVPQTATWFFSAVDLRFAKLAPVDTPPGIGSSQTAATPISGMAWFTQTDQTKVRVSFDQPAAHSLQPFAAADTNAGIPWFEPPDRDRPATKIWIEALPAIQLIPGTLPTPISGIGWFEPPDVDKKPVKINGEAQPGYAFPVPPVGISGIGWFEPPDLDKRPVKVNGEAQPAFSFKTPPVPISGMAWYEPADRDRPALKVSIESSPAFAVFSPAPPVGVSGMAWFAPKPDSVVVQVSFSTSPALEQPIVQIAPPPRGVGWPGREQRITRNRWYDVLLEEIQQAEFEREAPVRAKQAKADRAAAKKAKEEIHKAEQAAAKIAEDMRLYEAHELARKIASAKVEASANEAIRKARQALELIEFIRQEIEEEDEADILLMLMI